MSKKPDLFGDERICLVCRTPFDIERHHIYGGVGRRPISEREGCCVYLCHEHHQGKDGVHQNKRFRDSLRAECQRRWEMREGKGHEDFIRMFGESYL